MSTQFQKNTLNVFRSTVFNNKINDYTQDKADWYKIKPGLNQIRMLPLLANGQPSYLESCNHNFLKIVKEDGNIGTVSPVCLEFLFDNNEYCQNLLEKAIDAKKITEKDYDNFENAGGCPVCIVARKIVKADKNNTSNFPRNKTFMIIKDRSESNKEPNKLLLYGAPITVWRDFMGQAEIVENEDEVSVLDYEKGRDFRFTVVGQERNTKYEKMGFSIKQSAFGDVPEHIPDLNKVWLQGIRTFNEFVDCVRNTPELNKACIENDIEF